MLTQIVRTALVVASVACVFCAVGCQAPSTTTTASAFDHDGVCAAQLDRLVAKLNRPQPYPYRKPLRDRRARILRQISMEAEHLLAEPAVEAMTGDINADSQPAVRTAIESLRDAAERGDATGVRLAYHQYKNAE